MFMRSRPLSPHLQIYRWQLTSVLSILHRATGIALAGAMVSISLWLYALAWSPSFFEILFSFFQSFVGYVFIGGWVFSFYYHLFNGLRHLGWDLGFGFELKQVYRTGWGVVSVTALLTAITYGIMWLR